MHNPLSPTQDAPTTVERRQRRLAESLPGSGLYAIALNPGPSLAYLTGLHFHLSERPVLALFVPQEAPVLVLPELETAKLEKLPFHVKAIPYGEDPAAWVDAFYQASLAAGINNQRVGVEPTRLRFLELRMLESAAPKAAFVSAENNLASLRMKKDTSELLAMRKAVEIAQEALHATLATIHAGISERDIASELALQMLHLGSDSELSFAPIVSGGPNSANPHASPSERLLRVGDLLVIDWGAMYQGYTSDLTRTFAIGHVEDELRKIAEVVLQANAAGRAACRPGIPASDVDAAARQVIEEAGYGKYFFHRTGHGLGMEGHEPPYIRAGNDLLLEPGMTFTVEPGIYLPQRNGVRIEDNVVITADGAESLSDYPRELQVLE